LPDTVKSGFVSMVGMPQRASEILVAIDGSKHSEKVVDFAADAAKSMSAKIVLVYVVPNLNVPPDYGGTERHYPYLLPPGATKEVSPEEAVELPGDFFKEVSEKVFEAMGKIIHRKDVEYEGVYGFDNPTSFILSTAKSRKVSMIVVGVHGLHAVGRIRALGSVARRVIENADVPVMVVP
jgi:nucleotide-binding universal stress UspA family protein